MQPKQNEYELEDMDNPPPQGSSQPFIRPDITNIQIPSAEPNVPSIPPQPSPVQPLIYQQNPQIQPMIQPIYSTNIPMVQPQPYIQGGIIINQNQPLFPVQGITTNPIPMSCPYCKQQIITQVQTSFNCCACCFCCCFGIFYFLIQAIRGKELCCDDAIHRCPHCHNIVGTYGAL